MPTIRTMTLADYETVLGLMQQTPGVTLRDADSRDSTARYLARNPGLSFVATQGDSIIGCIMAGHDGRRGYLQHLLVHQDYRRQGMASALVERCLAALEAEGIQKSHIDVLNSNIDGAAYWAGQGWQKRTNITRYSFIRHGSSNA